jgi:hypothetical protein
MRDRIEVHVRSSNVVPDAKFREIRPAIGFGSVRWLRGRDWIAAPPNDLPVID